MSEHNIQNWLARLTETAKNNDFEKHMDLISENLASYNKASGQQQNYYDWRDQRKNAFQSGILENLSYDKLSIKNIGLRRLSFRVEETITTNGDIQTTTDKVVILEHEEDEQWRMVEEIIKH